MKGGVRVESESTNVCSKLTQFLRHGVLMSRVAM